jgi:hypothetical protein
MINIDDKLISEDVTEKHFVCNLSKCKGACCWEGDFGAPLTSLEIDMIKDSIDNFKEDLPERSQEYLENHPFFSLYDNDKFEGTALHADGACVFLTEENGISMCGIEKAHNEDKTPLRKPISCHLYPIRVNKDPNTGIQMINYDKWDICSAACSLGEELKIPVYQFAKEALIRQYGSDFYDQLDDIAKHLSQ